MRTDSAVLCREAVDLTGEQGEITALLGAGGVLGTGVVNPRYVLLPISPDVPAAGAFSEALGAKHVAELDLKAYGMDLACHIVDFGPVDCSGSSATGSIARPGSCRPSSRPRSTPDV